MFGRIVWLFVLLRRLHFLSLLQPYLFFAISLNFGFRLLIDSFRLILLYSSSVCLDLVVWSPFAFLYFFPSLFLWIIFSINLCLVRLSFATLAILLSNL